MREKRDPSAKATQKRCAEGFARMVELRIIIRPREVWHRRWQGSNKALEQSLGTWFSAFASYCFAAGCSSAGGVFAGSGFCSLAAGLSSSSSPLYMLRSIYAAVQRRDRELWRWAWFLKGFGRSDDGVVLVLNGNGANEDGNFHLRFCDAGNLRPRWLRCFHGTTGQSALQNSQPG